MKWSKLEEDLLITLRSAGVPYREKLKHFPGRTQDGLRNKMDAIRNQWRMNDLPNQIIAVLDIETSNFKADVGYMLSWAIYWPNTKETTWDVIKKRDITSMNLDKRICKTLLKELDRVELLIGYYSTRFDIPFMRTRCLMNGLDFPGYGSMRHIDCYYAARGKVATRRKTLKIISEALGLEGKTDVDMSIWKKAILGDQKSLDLVLEHNIADVKVTWNVYNELKKYGKYTSKSI
jgi:uncharacterized protein YprB with RNaseH-like and TPR domain